MNVCIKTCIDARFGSFPPLPGNRTMRASCLGGRIAGRRGKKRSEERIKRHSGPQKKKMSGKLTRKVKMLVNSKMFLDNYAACQPML